MDIWTVHVVECSPDFANQSSLICNLDFGYPGLLLIMRPHLLLIAESLAHLLWSRVLLWTNIGLVVRTTTNSSQTPNTFQFTKCSKLEGFNDSAIRGCLASSLVLLVPSPLSLLPSSFLFSSMTRFIRTRTLVVSSGKLSNPFETSEQNGLNRFPHRSTSALCKTTCNEPVPSTILNCFPSSLHHPWLSYTRHS